MSTFPFNSFWRAQLMKSYGLKVLTLCWLIRQAEYCCCNWDRRKSNDFNETCETIQKPSNGLALTSYNCSGDLCGDFFRSFSFISPTDLFVPLNPVKSSSIINIVRQRKNRSSLSQKLGYFRLTCTFYVYACLHLKRCLQLPLHVWNCIFPSALRPEP